MAFVQNLQYSATDTERADFLKKTYIHVALALLAFIGLESLLLPMAQSFLPMMLKGGMSWLLILGVFYVVSMFATKLSHNASKPMQYLGLGIYVVAYSILFLPMIYMAMARGGGSQMIGQAAFVTLSMFAGLSAVALFGNKDFSFLRSALMIGGFVAIGLIVAGVLFGFNLGLWFSVGMVVLASGSILYETSQIRNSYPTDMYVGAAVALFGSVMTLFWYILRIFMSRD